MLTPFLWKASHERARHEAKLWIFFTRGGCVWKGLIKLQSTYSFYTAGFAEVCQTPEKHPQAQALSLK